MFERIIHRWLRIPYTLNVHYFHNPTRPTRTIVLIHGLGTSWRTWEQVAAKLPKTYRVVAVDLLGFGSSPTPNWKTYNVATQAKSISLTLVKRGIIGPVTIIGHSMGSLVAIELAKPIYPVSARALILCSPPIYRPETNAKLHHPERLLRRLYRFFHRHPSKAKQLLQLADRYNLWPDRGFKAKGATADSFLKALSAAIINQTTLRDIQSLRLPITIISGKLDPLIVESNLKQLAKERPNITHSSLLTQGHEISNRYAAYIAKKVTDMTHRRKH